MREALDALIAEMVDKGILFEEARTEFERRFLHCVLARADGNQSLAARRLGMHRNTFSRRLAELAGTPRRPPTAARPAKPKHRKHHAAPRQ